MSKIKIIFTVFLILTACNKPSIIGEWIQPIAGMENQVQGINLEADGKASSINMYTLLYETWKQDGNKLILTGKSIGNGQTIEFSQEYEISKLESKELILKDGGQELVYQKKRK